MIPLTQPQLDGCACVTCGDSHRPMLPLGLETRSSSELFRCDRPECAIELEQVRKRIPAASRVRHAPWVTLVGYPRDSLAGKFLEGPRDPKKVKRNGYGFTTDPKKAWPFPSEKQAAAKARIIERHMGWGEGVMVVGPLAEEMQNQSNA